MSYNERLRLAKSVEKMKVKSGDEFHRIRMSADTIPNRWQHFVAVAVVVAAAAVDLPD